MKVNHKMAATTLITLALILASSITSTAHYSLTLPTGIAGFQDSSVFTSSETIRSAQMVLRDRGYYNGPINGVLNGPTRLALERFQRDRNLPVTGNLNMRTARALGIANDTGSEAVMVQINNPRAERAGRTSVRIMLDAVTRSGGWRVFTDHFVSDNTLHVYVRGVPPLNPSTQALDQHSITETFDDVPPGVTRAVFHGSQRDLTVNIERGGIGNQPDNNPGTPGTQSGVGNPRQIAFLTDRLMNSYMQELNLRNNRGQVIFDRRQSFRENQIELLFHLRSLQAAADLYNRLIGAVDDAASVKGAADSLIRQARLVNRLMRRVDPNTLSATVRNDWESLRSELRNITVTNNDLDNEERIR
jgi:peptidoglycan hydrolase-like protein with peptidoglycan-binding domain